jgi:hypothetical protein
MPYRCRCDGKGCFHCGATGYTDEFYYAKNAPHNRSGIPTSKSGGNTNRNSNDDPPGGCIAMTIFAISISAFITIINFNSCEGSFNEKFREDRNQNHHRDLGIRNHNDPGDARQMPPNDVKNPSI